MDSDYMQHCSFDVHKRIQRRSLHEGYLSDVDRRVRQQRTPRVAPVITPNNAIFEASRQHGSHILTDLLTDDQVRSLHIEQTFERPDRCPSGEEICSQEAHGPKRYWQYDRIMDLVTFTSPEDLASGAADFITARMSQPGPRLNLGLAGGSTPAATYEQLRWRSINWSNIDVWLSDERWVDHQSPDSNGRMAHETLIDHVDGANLLRPRYNENLEPDESAVHYEASLRHIMSDGRPDLILLGMGTDGHTASLFPGTTALEEDRHRWFVSNWVEAQDTWRLTATPNLLKSAKQVVVIVSGAAKADVLAEILNDPSGRYPTELLHDSEGSVTVLADSEAASAV